jgi:hypothetical protein
MAVAMLSNRPSPGTSGGGKVFISDMGRLAATSM